MPLAPRPEGGRSRRALRLLAALMLVGAVATTLPAPRPAAAATGSTTSALNLRTGPGADYRVILVMPAGASVWIAEDRAQGSYVPVTYQGTDGWAASAYLTTGGGTTDGGTTDGGTTGSGTGAATTTTAVNLRAGPSTGDAVLAVMPAGAGVTLTGQSANGFLSVSYQGRAGWASADYLTTGGSSPAPTPAPGGSTGTATTTSVLNLRSGPSTGDAVLAVMPAGASVSLTGQRSNGFSSVTYQGRAGWAATQYLSTGGAAPAPTPTPAPGGDVGTATTTSSLNLRSGPSTGEAVLTVMPAGATVTLTGSQQSGFYPVRYGGQNGWASASYLSVGGAPGTPTPAPSPGGGSTGIAWPFAGGGWTVIQGYNGGTHTNRSATAQYKYSLDLARASGGTAGQTVLAPVSGTIRWVHRPSGGILIDVGNGYGVAMFHVTYYGGLGSGQWVSRGQAIGSVSGVGGEGYAATPHIDLTCWQLSAGGGRTSVPFSGPNTISGRSFPDVGGSGQYYGVAVP